MEQTTDAGFDPKRRLCPDGACVGVIGADGRCKVCGRAGDGSVAALVREAPVDADAEVGVATAAAAAEVGLAATAGEDEAVEGGGFDPRRRLCDDGTCIGVLGPDGVCPVCGRRAETAGGGA
jgi:hypothetical protein